MVRAQPLLTLQVDMYGKQHTDGTEGSSLDAALESGTLRSPSCSPRRLESLTLRCIYNYRSFQQQSV